MTNDNPRTRKQMVCPFCLGRKDVGLVACWPCFKSSGLKDGSTAAEAKLAKFEAALCRE